MKRNNAKGKAAPSLIWETGTLKFDLVFFNVQYLYHFFLATNKTHLSSVYFEKSHVFNLKCSCSVRVLHMQLLMLWSGFFRPNIFMLYEC